MKILILGGDGMLGHELLQNLSNSYNVYVTLRGNEEDYKKIFQFDSSYTYYSISVDKILSIQNIISNIKPHVVINCIGVVKQSVVAENAIESIKINSLFPHQLLTICKQYKSRLIHISTDCVFSGNKGSYIETDIPDPIDIYGKSKLLGEVIDESSITLRTSIIGLELSRKQGLIEWFLAQRGTIYGYKNAIFSGLTTSELSSVIKNVLSEYTDLYGLWHVSSMPISKLDLLNKLSIILKRGDVEILVDDQYKCDRSLNCSKFISKTGYKTPSWDEMLNNLSSQIKMHYVPPK